MRAMLTGDAAMREAAEQADAAFVIVDHLAGESLADSARKKIAQLQTVLQQLRPSLAAIQDYLEKLQADAARLKEELLRLQDWEAERKTYELRRFDPGVFVYRRRPASVVEHDLSSEDEGHLLCPYCFDAGRKSILQSTPKFERRYQVHMCPECKNEFAFYYAPNHP